MQGCNVLASKLKLGKLILMKIIKIVATSDQMPYFKAKMHQIRFWPRCGAAPDLLARFKAGPTSKGRKRREWSGRVSRIFSSVCWQC